MVGELEDAVVVEGRVRRELEVGGATAGDVELDLQERLRVDGVDECCVRGVGAAVRQRDDEARDEDARAHEAVAEHPPVVRGRRHARVRDRHLGHIRRSRLDRVVRVHVRRRQPRGRVRAPAQSAPQPQALLSRRLRERERERARVRETRRERLRVYFSAVAWPHGKGR